MSKTTTNYKFVKPELSDAADITAANENWDKLDAELEKKYDSTTVVPIENGGTGATAVSSAKINLGIPTFTILGVAPLHCDVFDFDYFIVKDSNDGTLLFTNISRNRKDLELTANCPFNNGSVVGKYVLRFYWGDGGYMVDCVIEYFNIGSGTPIGSGFTFNQLIGVKIYTQV
jgi:hypothetical protein